MAAFVVDFEAEVGVGLFGESDVVGNAFAVDAFATAAFVEAVGGVD